MLLSVYKNWPEAGCDEAGRGCLAGPVIAAAVIFPENYSSPLVNDSKKLNVKTRNELRIVIEKEALSFGIGMVDNEEIDKINILQASFLAMHRALEQLSVDIDHILVDGNRFKTYKNVSHTCIVKGDAKYLSIAAASVLAKTYRDEYMSEQAIKYPWYSWQKNKGYPTKIHRDAIREFGICELHRKSFTLLPEQSQLTLF